MRFDLRLLLLALVLARLPPEAKTVGLPDHVTQHMDRSISPCRDFYAHACGNWSAVHESDPYRSLLDQLDHNYHQRLATLLDQVESSGQEARFLQLPRAYYASCRRSLDMPQVLAFLERLIPEPELDIDELTVAMTAAFRLKVLVEMGDGKMEKIWLKLLLRHDPEWDRNETRREPLERPQFEQLWLQMPARGRPKRESFWLELSQLERDLIREDDDDDNEVFLDKLDTPAYWMLPWRRSPPSLSHIRRLTSLLAAKTPQFLIPYILLRLRLAGGGLAKAQAWQVERSECAEQCRQLLSHPSVWLLEKDQPRLPEEPVLQDIFRTLKHRFGQKLRANRNAFGRPTLKFLLSKLEHMTLRLSVLPRSGSVHSLERRLEHHYRELQLNASDYFGNLLAALRQDTLEVGMPLLKRRQPLPVKPHGYGSFASPFYLLMSNTLVVPLSLLGPPLYTPGQSELLTYSSLGYILGHELSHGFTPGFVPIDSRGQYHLSVGRERLRLRRFQQQVRCLRWRFGERQLDEKFADFNGLELAYSAYFDAVEGDTRWDQAPSTTWSLPRQQFFLNFAQFFCSDEDGSQDNDDDHGSDSRRVNDAVANFQPFREAFGCPSKKTHKKLQCRLY